MERKAVCFIGRSGSGKGTLADILAVNTEFVVISTGRLFDAECERDTPLGTECRMVRDGHKFLRDELIFELIARATALFPDVAGFIFEGAPRSGGQSHWLMGEFDCLFVWLDVPAEVCYERLLGRSRPDYDTPEGITRRNREFDDVFPSIQRAIGNDMYRVNGNRPVSEVAADVAAVCRQLQTPSR